MRLPVLLIGLILLAGLAALRLADPAPLGGIRLAYFDALQRIAPRQATDARVRVIDIDETSLARFGQWPWPRDLLADLTDRLHAAGARAIAFDMIFAEPDRMSLSRLAENPDVAPFLQTELDPATLARLDNDAVFANSIAAAPVVLGIARSDTPDPTAETKSIKPKAPVETFSPALTDALPVLSPKTRLVPDLYDTTSGIGAISVGPGGNGSVSRTLPLLWNTPNGPVAGLALETLRVALGADMFVLWGLESDPNTLGAIGVGDHVIPVTQDATLWLRVRPADPDAYIPAHEILEGRDLSDLSGAIVLVGTSAAGLLDLRMTALGETVPGVAIHAQAIEQILTGRYLIRTDYAGALELAMFIFAGLLVIVAMSRAGPIPSILVGSGAGFAIMAASWAAYLRTGLLLDATFPLIGGFLLFSILTLYRLFVTDRDARLIRQSFSHYVAPDVLRDIEEHGHKVSLGGINQPVTVLFTDIRNFTGLSQTLDAQSIVGLLNRLFDTLSDAIKRHQGTIDKYMGDSIMAFWNAPVPVDDHSMRACRAALAMREAMSGFNANASTPIAMGIGISTGEACVGNIGSRERFNYTAIGDTVNLSARIETACREVEFDILASEAVQSATPSLAWLDAGWLEAKGMGARVPMALLLGDETLAQSPAFQALSAAHAEFADTLGRGVPLDAALSACLRASVGFPALAPFYHRMAERSADFADRPLASAV